MSRIELEIPRSTHDERQQAFRYYSALHTLSISKDRQEIYLFLTENKMRLQDQQNECEDEIVLRWLQGAIQMIDSFLDYVDNAEENINNLRKVM